MLLSYGEERVKIQLLLQIVWPKNLKTFWQKIAHKGYASSYNVEILNSFNFELQLKGTDSAVRNKLKDLLTVLRGFKLVTIVFLNSWL